MSRPKKEYVPFSCRLAKEVSDELTMFCDETGMTKTRAIEMIMSMFFKHYFSKPEEERVKW